MADFTVNLGEKQEWKTALEDYMFENPTDWIAKWLYGGMGSGMWEESMYADILRDWYGGMPSLSGYWAGRPGRGRGAPQGMIPEPAWMSELGLIAERGEDIRGPFQQEEYEAAMLEKYGEHWWMTGPSRMREEREGFYETAPGQATTLRPMGAQMNLTTEQLDQLMYYLAYTKGGQPESRKEYLQTVAYKMPGWIQDYISTSQAVWPTVAPPKATTRPAWQR